jgi:methyl-accepting chemotaxis protein
MSQEEDPEKEKDSDMFGSLGRWAKYGFAGVGVIASLIGLVLVVVVYLTLSPTIGTLRTTTLGQLDNAANTVTDLDKSLASAYDGIAVIPDLSQNLSEGFQGYATSTGQLADGIDSIADKLSGIPGVGSTESLKSAATNLRASSNLLGAQADSLSTVSSSIRDSQQGIKSVRSDLTKAKSDLSKAKRDVDGAFDAVSSTFLIFCIMLALVFIAVGAYSAALFL